MDYDISFSFFIQQLGEHPMLLISVLLTLGVIFVNGWTDAPNAIATCVSTRCIDVNKAILMAAVCQGAAAACGLILVVGTLVSYVLYWFTRFMWYVLSSPQRNKFAFGGFKREVYGDDE